MCPFASIFSEWETVVYNNRSVLTVDTKFDRVTASFVYLLCQDDCLDPFWELSNRGDARKKVAVTTVALENVGRIQFIIHFKVFTTISVVLGWTFPNHLLPLFIMLMTLGFV